MHRECSLQQDLPEGKCICLACKDQQHTVSQTVVIQNSEVSEEIGQAETPMNLGMFELNNTRALVLLDENILYSFQLFNSLIVGMEPASVQITESGERPVEADGFISDKPTDSLNPGKDALKTITKAYFRVCQMICPI